MFNIVILKIEPENGVSCVSNKIPGVFFLNFRKNIIEALTKSIISLMIKNCTCINISEIKIQ